MWMGHVWSKLKYFGCVLDESGTYVAECRRKAEWKGSFRCWKDSANMVKKSSKNGMKSETSSE